MKKKLSTSSPTIANTPVGSSTVTTLKLIFLKKVDKKYIKIIYLTYLCPTN